MTERPIIMSAESVRAILAGWKTQTRRVAKNPIECPYGQPGDLLYVKETWAEWGSVHGHPCYRADEDKAGVFWRSPMVMPRRYSRLLLQITAVREERLKDISQSDAWAEGMMPKGGDTIAAYAAEWDHLNAKLGFPWASNPVVWVIQFKWEVRA